MKPIATGPPIQTSPPDTPVIPPGTELPEITLKGMVLSIVLAAVLAGANAYLGLFAGMTVSASIPAAVLSMAVLRLFRHSNILENNIVQTAASSGEALAAGVIFTIPALILIGYWTSFDYWQTASIALVGGLLGVLFTIPLRHALIVQARLRFPEGVATAEVLKVGADAEAGSSDAGARQGVKTLLTAALLGGAVKLGESGLGLWAEALEGAARIGRSVVYAGVNLSPALLAVGYIIGLRTAVVVCFGGVLGWLVLMPLYGLMNGLPNGTDALAQAKSVWSGHIRYVGIGAMLVGGLWTLVQLRRPIYDSLLTVRQAYRTAGSGSAVPRTERDASLPWIVGPFLLALIPMTVIYAQVVGHIGVAIGMTLVMVVAAFLFSSVAAYMAGLVGSSSNPVSGVTIATIMLAALLLVLVMGQGNPAGPAATLLIGAVVCCAAAMGGDNLQDLKTGHLVGATPWKQQIMQVVGVAVAACVIVPVLALLQAKYGIGEVTAVHPHPLSAPQATLMASLARGVFGEGLPWPMVGLGAGIGVGVIVFDRWLDRQGSSFRAPVLAVALGIYLPLKLSAAILIGGLIAELAHRIAPQGKGSGNGGLLFAAGLVTGEALMGILLALPIALSSLWPSLGADPFKLFATPPLGAWPGLLAVAGVGWMLYRTTTGSRSKRA
ncbi:MAG: oligopeptide transporter, OPT family [Nitrospirae bacterium]|nr:MAG: oligopeptide transporter, OPT family [Nitrospirota bacterium]